MKELTRRRFAVPAFAFARVSWWMLVVILALGLAFYVGALWDGIVTFPAVGVLGVVLATPLGIAWWWLLRLPQLWVRIRRSTAWVAFGWGAVVATGIYALPSNSALITILGQRVGIDFAQAWGPALAAPLTEEVGKAFAIAMILAVTREKLRTPMDGALIAGFAGLGFTLTEDILYGFNVAYISFGENPVVSTLIVFFMRAVLFGAVSHVIFSAFVGAGVAWFVTGVGPRRVALGAVFVFIGFFMHFAWNSPWLLELWARGIYILVVPFLVWWGIHMVRGEEHRWFRRTLAAPGALGAIPPVYLDAVRPTWRQRRAYRKNVVRAFGPAALASQRRLEAELTDLADAVAMGDDADAARLRGALEARLVPKEPVGA